MLFDSRDRSEARKAVGCSVALQGKTAQTDAAERFTTPTLVFERDGVSLIAGGLQPLEARDTLIANLDPELTRQAPPDGPLSPLSHFVHGFTTHEVAVLLADENDLPDRASTEASLIELVAAGEATRKPLVDAAVWLHA